MEDDSIPYKDGFLLFPPQGMLGQLKKSWQRRRCQLFRSGQRGIARLEVWEDERGASQRIITLQDCVKITPDTLRSQPNAFTIVNKSGEHALASIAAEETGEWIAALQTVAFPEHCAHPSTVEADNDLYYSVPEDGVFTVMLIPTDASRRCSLAPGEYTLAAGASALMLRDTLGSLKASWPYRFIRRYGYSDGAFTLEAGRLCSTGEGSFRLGNPARRDIYRCISLRMRDMRLSLGADDATLAVAVGLEPRTRTPLPPGPTPSSRPQKPPRKHVPPPTAYPAYDCVEVRTEAWRTLGAGETEHTERAAVPQPDDPGATYDTLQHMGPASRPDPGYRTVPVRPDKPPVDRTLRPDRPGSPPRATDRVIVELEAGRGYGMIRKQPAPAHLLHNETEYALVEKPKKK